VLTDQETSVAKPNYHHARKQKELARKARQQEKQQRRSARPGARDENLATTQADASATRSDPTGGGTSGSGA
jgi:ribosome assembly protein YihI (activator of Der GTPase)